jgi:hypothetical protein
MEDRMIRSASVLGMLALVMACGSDDESKFVEQPPPLGGTPDGGFTTTTTPPTDDCTEAAKLAYVLSEQNDLYSFAPDQLKFTKIGPLACPGTTAKPFSMTIDRTGLAWVNYSDGKLFNVSTKDASCTATTFAPSQLGYRRFAMAFATNGTNTKEETLYIAGVEDGLSGVGKGLGTLDRTTLKLTAIADFSAPLAAQFPELTGTGDGKLYGFFRTKPDATLAQIDRATAATSNLITLTGLDAGNAFAFTFWGGEFYMYTAPAGDTARSKVTKVKPTGEKAVVIESVGAFRIVGAGVSTCAPIEPIVR